MCASRINSIGPLTGPMPAFNAAVNANGLKALGQTQDAPVFPVSDRRLSSRSMMIAGPELVHTAKIVWRDTVDVNSDLNMRLRHANLRFSFTGKARLDNGSTADPGRLSEVLQPRGMPRSGAKKLADAENSPAPNGAVLSSAFAHILCSLAMPPAEPAPAEAAAPAPPTAIAAPAPATIVPLPKATAEAISSPMTKISDTAATKPTGPMEIDALPIEPFISAALLAADPPSTLVLETSPTCATLPAPPVLAFAPAPVAEVAAQVVEEASSQAIEAAKDESSPDASSEGDADEEEDDASHEQDANEDGSSSSEFVPHKKRSGDDAEAASGDSDASDGSDDDEDEGDSESSDSDSGSDDKASEEYDERAEEGEEEEDEDDDDDDIDDGDDDDDEDPDSDDAPLIKTKKRKSAAASPPKKRTADIKKDVKSVRAAAPAPVLAVVPAPTAVIPAPVAKPEQPAPDAEPYPVLTKLLGAKYLQQNYVNDSADKQTLTAIYNVICLRNGVGVFPNPLREALQPGFQFDTANKKQKQALEIHAIELAEERAELQHWRSVAQKMLEKHPDIGDKMRQVLRIICSEKHVIFESMPLIPTPGQRCELTNVEMVYEPRRNIIPRSCRLITIGPATITAFTASELTFGALNFFYHYFHMAHLAIGSKLDSQTPKCAAGLAMKFYVDQHRFGTYVKEWAVDGDFKKPDFGLAGIAAMGSNFSFHWKK